MNAAEVATSRNHEYITDSGRECFFALQEWAQDARLYSEAIFRLKNEISGAQQPFKVTNEAWDLGRPDKYKFPERVTAKRLEALRQKNWRSQFILLEGIWEIFLEMLYRELAEKFPEALEDLCRQSPPEFLVRTQRPGSTIEFAGSGAPRRGRILSNEAGVWL
jgi:hypothetical protein